MHRTLRARIDRAEEAAKAKRLFSGDCICFPENEPPCFVFPCEEEIAARVKCPLHGDRFKGPILHIYMGRWRRAKEPARRELLSAQHRKAWDAGFPPDLWPAEEEETADGTIYLKLKDGTRIFACEPAYKRAVLEGLP